MAADTGTYRLGRNGRGGAEAGTPTPPPTPPPLKPGIRDRERGEEDSGRGRCLLSTYCKGCFTGQNGEYGLCLGGGAMTTHLKRKPTLCKAATERKHEGLSVYRHSMSPGTNTITQKQRIFFIYLAIYSSTCMCTACGEYLIYVHNLNRGL